MGFTKDASCDEKTPQPSRQKKDKKIDLNMSERRFCTATDLPKKKKKRVEILVISLYSIFLTEYAIVFVHLWLFNLSVTQLNTLFFGVVTVQRPTHFSMINV